MKERSRLAILLLEWYQEHRRDLPWRETRDPYRIWISEIILQQTRVVQGLEYYRRFTERFPTVAELAEADQDEVMKLWQGLGYYSRARNLLAAARMVGRNPFPATYESVKALPGIGDYTAAAVCSIAYGLPFAVVDGNVYRVLARYFGIDTPIDGTKGKKEFARLAQEMLPQDVPGEYNQAIMDFGALQCVPLSPDCGACPLADSCAARAEGRVEELPVKERKQKVTDVYLHYIYVRIGREFCLHRRMGSTASFRQNMQGFSEKAQGGSFSGSAIWKGLYEPPLVETPVAVSPEDFLKSPEFAGLFASEQELSDATVAVLHSGGVHLLSHRRLHLHFYSVVLPAGARSFSDFLHVPLENRADYPVPHPIEKLWLLLRDADK